MKKITFLVALLLAAISANAINDSLAHNLNFNIGGGYHSLIYKPLDGKWKGAFDGMVGFNYQVMFTDSWGFSVGLQAVNNRASAVFNYTADASNYAYPGMIDGGTYTAEKEYSNWTERQRVISVGLPIRAIYQHSFNPKWALRLGLGLDLNFVAQNKYYTYGGQYSMTAYNNGVAYDPTPAAGFETCDYVAPGSYSNMSPLNIGVGFDLGGRYNFVETAGLYFGVYCRYGFTNYLKASNQGDMFVVSDNGPAYNGAWNSNRVNAVNPLQVGFKLGFDINLNKTESAAGKKRRHAREQAIADSIAAAERAKFVADSLAEAERIRQEQLRLERERLERERRAKEDAAERLRQREKFIRDSLAAAFAADSIRIANLQKELDRLANMINLNVHFQQFKTTPILNTKGEQAMKELSELMAKNPDITLNVIGHTDDVGEEEANLRMGQLRADEFKLVMIAAGIPAKRLVTDSKGESEPIASNATAEGKALNRRIQLKPTAYISEEAVREALERMAKAEGMSAEQLDRYLDHAPDTMEIKPLSKAKREELEKNIYVMRRQAVYRGTGTKGSVTLTKIGDEAARIVRSIMIAYPHLAIEIIGNTDNTGNSNDNMITGQYKAERFRETLIGMGFPIDRIYCNSNGDKKPIADNSTSEGRAKNKRFEVEIIELKSNEDKAKHQEEDGKRMQAIQDRVNK